MSPEGDGNDVPSICSKYIPIKKKMSPEGDGNTYPTTLITVPSSIKKKMSPEGDGNGWFPYPINI